MTSKRGGFSVAGRMWTMTKQTSRIASKLFQIRGLTTWRAQLATADSLTGCSTRRLCASL